MTPARPRPNPMLVAWAALAALALGAAALASRGANEAGLRLAIRLTARESYLIFLAVFAASPANLVFTSAATRWLLRNRRLLGLSLATSQALHLVFIVALASAYPASFARRLALTTAVGGGFGYLLLALMTATSFDAPAAWIGRRAWRALHTVGIWTLWVIFAFTYGGIAVSHPLYLVVLSPLVALTALRVVAARRRAARRSARPDEVRPASAA